MLTVNDSNQKNKHANSPSKGKNPSTKGQSTKNPRNSQDFPSFQILDYLDRIEIFKTTDKEYHCLCPVCGDGGFKIEKATGKYNAFKCGCDVKDIREAIRPWSEVKKASRANQKTVRPQQYREWIYQDRQGNPLIKVCRSDDGKGGKPKRWQQSWDVKEWVKGYGAIKQKDIPIYKYQEIQEAIARGETIFVVEGEPCADILWELGIPATTNIGGSGKWLASHTKDLEGAKLVILSPDRDKPGVKHMEAIASEIANVKWLYPFPDSPLWSPKLPPNQGLDVVDWVKDGATKEDILAAIEEEARQFNLDEDRAIAENNRVIEEETVDTRPIEEVLIEQIDEILAENLSQGELDAKIIALADSYSRGTRDIWKLYRSRSEQLEQTENLKTTKEEVSRLLEIQSDKIELKDYLPRLMSDPLEKLATHLGVNNATLLTALLTTSASLLPINTKLELIKATSFYARPILYSGICAPSGSGKSPAFKAVLDPLFELQKEEDSRYILAEQEYKQSLKAYKKAKDSNLEEPEAPPPPREYFVTDSTSEAIANIQNNQPNNGFLGYFDELKQLIGQSNSYRGGKGADIEKLLSGRDGSGFKVNRASGTRISCSRSGYSILGGIQPEVLRKQMGDFSDGNGFWARFIWVNQPMQRKPFPDDEVNINISPLLRSLYEFLGKIDNTFVLSPKAKEKYKDWYIYVEDRKFQEVKPALQAVWSKSQRLVGELALLLHCLTYAVEGQQPPSEVAPEILDAAIKLAKFYMGQIELIHADGEPESSNQPHTYTKLIELSQRKGWITARDVKVSIRNYRTKTPSQIRSLFREIEAVGYGITQGVGNKLKWNYQTVDSVDKNSDQKTPPPQKTPQLKSDLDVDNKINNSSNNMSTENSSNPNTVRNKPCQQFVDSSSTENHQLQSNETVDSLSTKSSTSTTVSTENSPSSFNIGDRVLVKSKKVEGKVVGQDVNSGLYEIAYLDSETSIWEGPANLLCVDK